MDDLIKALQIFRKYGNPQRPIQCTYDELHVPDIDHRTVSPEDIKELYELGFFVDEEEGGFYSWP